MPDHLTVGDTAKHFGCEPWKIRRVVDRLDADIPRAGQYRLIPRDLLPQVEAALRDRGFLPAVTEPVCAQRAS